MGTTGSIAAVRDKNIEMNIEDELKENPNGRSLIKKRHGSQPQNFLSNSKPRSKNDGEGMRQTSSLYSIDAPNALAPNVPLPADMRRENELKITKEQEIQALQRKEQKLDVENSRLRAELKALNKQCQKLRAERDVATESCHDATERAIALEQDREKIQRQFKIFRETKESEIQALLQEKRKLESQLHRLQAHGVATGDNNSVYLSNMESIKQRVAIPESPTPQNQWWGIAESETTSLFGSYTQIQNATNAENNESLVDLQSLDKRQNMHSDSRMLSTANNLQLTASSNFGSNTLLPDYSELEYLDRSHLRCYVTGTPDCYDEIIQLINCKELSKLKESCMQEGCYLSVTTLENTEVRGVVLSSCNRSVSVDSLIKHVIGISNMVICFLGHEVGHHTELACQVGHLDSPGEKSAFFALKKNNGEISGVISSLRLAIEHSKNRSLEYFDNSDEGVNAAMQEIARAVKLELGVGFDDSDDLASDEVRCVNELQRDDAIEQAQREIGAFNKNEIKPVGFQKYFERLNDLVTSPGPLPPLLISGGNGSGKTLLIKTWIDCLQKTHQNITIFQYYVSHASSVTADPIIMMRRIVSQILSQLPPSMSPPSFTLSSYDVANLKSALPRWLDRLSTSKNARIVLAIDSMDLISDAKSHFKWLLDPLPVGVRVVISVGVNSCPDIWRQWPTLHLEPLSFQSVREFLSESCHLRKIQITESWVNEISSHCRSASTCHPLYVMVLLSVLCGTGNNNKKDLLLKMCLKTGYLEQIYTVLLNSIEEECIGNQVQEQLRQLLLLVYCSRDGLYEFEILSMVHGLTWQNLFCLRFVMLRYCILTEQAGMLCFHNSQITLCVRDRYVDKSSEKATIRTLVQYFASKTSLKHPRTAKILPWLLRRMRSESYLQECLVHPFIFHHLYRNSRAGEIVKYWEYCKRDKQDIMQRYKTMLANAGGTKQGIESRDSIDISHNSNTKRKRRLIPDDANFTLPPLLLSHVLESAGRFFRDLGLMEDAVSALQRSMEIREAELYPDHPLVADSLHYLASVYSKWHKFTMAEPLIQQSLELVESAVGQQHPRVMEELQSLCYIAHKQNRHEHADMFAKRMNSLQNRNGGALFNLSRIEKLKRRTLKLEELSSGQESVNLAKAINELGVLCAVQKNYSMAETFLERSLEMRENLLGVDHGDVAQSLHNLSAVYSELGKSDLAIKCMKKALEIRKDVYGSRSPLVLSTQKCLAALYKKTKDYNKAKVMYKELLNLSEQINGEDSSSTATALVNLAVIESELGEHKTALPLYNRALVIYTEKNGERSKQAADTLRNIAVLKYEQEEYEEAALLYKKSLKIKEELKNRKSNSWR